MTHFLNISTKQVAVHLSLTKVVYKTTIVILFLGFLNGTKERVHGTT